uniref:G-protein coupled receptors family 1 profile domain-containing protein n=1 Tax=Arion vulgaris TaxID=1028688 RepID=A0A0B6ZHU5_9EUPU
MEETTEVDFAVNGKDKLTFSVSIINDQIYLMIMFINMGIICQTFTVFGTVNNVINIIIFIRQGFSDTINISLLALAISDLCSLLTIMWSNLCFTSYFEDAGVPLVGYEVQLISGSWPHVTFTRTTGWVTAFISFERCMCVIAPLKVKTIFTPTRHFITMVTIFAITLGCSTLAYVSLGLGWRFFPERNKTLIGLAYHMDANKRKITDAVSYAVNGVFMPVSCFLSVVICTAFLVTKLNQQTAWRNINSSTTQTIKSDKVISTKESKAATMVVFISVIFIASFIPAVGIFVAGYVEPQLSYDGLYKNLFLVTLSVSFIAEVINSSINIFVYIGMSTKYRETFQSTFRLRKLSYDKDISL